MGTLSLPDLPEPDDATLKAASEGPLKASSPSIPPEVAKAEPSARFGKFVRTELLGAGGMGEVWKAWDTVLSRWVALKFLKGDAEIDVARFRREASIAGRLRHPNLAAIYEVGEDQGRHWIAMQFIAGTTLKAFPRTDLKGLIRLLRDAARALQVAHDEGIIHRDIKPDNLMVARVHKPSPESGEFQLYVMDFGLARPVDGAERLTQSGALVGTPAYMAPEQAAGKPLDRRSDVWSLGATLYELLTDHKPFSGTTTLEVIKAVQEEEPKAPNKLSPKIPRDLETVTMKCLEKAPERRYATVRELADDLDRWLNGKAILAKPPSAVYLARKRLARRKALAAAFILMVAVLGLSAWQGLAYRERVRTIEADLKAGQVLLSEGKLDAAEMALRRVQTVDSSNPAAHAGLSDIKGRRERAGGYLSDAKGCLEGVMAILATEDWTDAELDKLIGEARGKLGQALKEYSTYPLARFEMGKSYLLKMDGPNRLKAIEWFQPDRLESSLQVEAYLLLGTTKLEKYEDLRHVFTGKPNDMTPEMAMLYREIAQALEKVKSLNPDFKRLKYAEGLSAFAEGRYGDAAKLLSEHAKGSGFDFLGFRLACHAWHHVPDHDHVISTAGSALRFYPKDYGTLRLLGMAYDQRSTLHKNAGRELEATNDLTAARVCYEKLPSPESLFFLALVAFNGMQYDVAIQKYGEFAKIQPNYPPAYNNRGIAYFLKGDYESARKDYEQALKLHAQYADPHLGLGDLHVKLKNLELAITHYSKAIEIDSVRAFQNQAYSSRGLAMARLGQAAAASKDFEYVVTQDPKNIYAGLHVWYLSQDAGIPKADAIRTLEKLAPRYEGAAWPSPVFEFLAGRKTPELCLEAARKGDSSKAKERLCKAYYYLGQWHRTNGNKALARESFEKCLETGMKESGEYLLGEAFLSRLGN